MRPSKRDAWSQPARWAHCWVRFDRSPQPPPAPGFVLDWKKDQGAWKAWVIWLDNSSGRGERIMQGWLPIAVLRPAKSDINVWNDGPWR